MHLSASTAEDLPERGKSSQPSPPPSGLSSKPTRSPTMPLRIATLETTERQDILTPQQWRERIAHLKRSATAAAASGNVGEIRTALASISSWTDPQRAFQGRCALAEAALSTPASGTVWLQVFPIVAEALLEALE